MSRTSFLGTVGARVRAQRESRGMSRRELSEQSGVSERFLAELESGRGNISLARFAEVCGALAASPAELLSGTEEARRPAAVALLGVRGAGKSTIGAALASRLGAPFVELDQQIEQAAGLSLGEIFELHGEAHYRRLEREALRGALDGFPPGRSPPERDTRSRGMTPWAPRVVLATGGSIVSDGGSYTFLRGRARTVWLRARAEDHWDRVNRQGDRRPMAENPHAFAQLRQLIAAREPLYARAHHIIDTTGRSVTEVVDLVHDALGA